MTLRRTAGPKISPSTTETAAVLQISGFLPVDRSTTSPLYTLKGAQLEGTVTVSLWPALMEKAFAQMWGGYTSLDGAEEFPVFAALGLTEKFIVNWYGNYLGKTPAAQKKIIQLAAEGWALTAATSMGGPAQLRHPGGRRHRRPAQRSEHRPVRCGRRALEGSRIHQGHLRHAAAVGQVPAPFRLGDLLRQLHLGLRRQSTRLEEMTS